MWWLGFRCFAVSMGCMLLQMVVCLQGVAQWHCHFELPHSNAGASPSCKLVCLAISWPERALEAPVWSVIQHQPHGAALTFNAACCHVAGAAHPCLPTSTRAAQPRPGSKEHCSIVVGSTIESLVPVMSSGGRLPVIVVVYTKVQHHLVSDNLKTLRTATQPNQWHIGWAEQGGGVM
jgi:hypothetical protein